MVGIAALVLEADPTATPQEVKDALMHTARTDTYTGAIPTGGSTQWGMGKVNAYQAVREVLWMNNVSERDAAAIRIWPAPTNGLVNIHLGELVGPVQVVVSDVTGRVVYSTLIGAGPLLHLDATTWAAGHYAVRCSTAGRVFTGALIRE